MFSSPSLLLFMSAGWGQGHAAAGLHHKAGFETAIHEAAVLHMRSQPEGNLSARKGFILKRKGNFSRLFLEVILPPAQSCRDRTTQTFRGLLAHCKQLLPRSKDLGAQRRLRTSPMNGLSKPWRSLTSNRSCGDELSQRAPAAEENGSRLQKPVQIRQRARYLGLLASG